MRCKYTFFKMKNTCVSDLLVYKHKFIVIVCVFLNMYINSLNIKYNRDLFSLP